MTAVLVLILLGVPCFIALVITQMDRHVDYWKEFRRGLPEMHYLGYQNNPETFE